MSNETQIKLILVVEDDAMIRDVIIEIFEEEGYQVVGAGNGQEALNYLRSHEALPALILLDLMMPIMDGWQFRVAQLNDPKLKSIPIIIVTAGGNAQQNAIKAGANGWVKKPFEINTLTEEVRRCCA